VLILVFLVIPTIQTIALSFTRTVKVSEAAILGTIERAIRGPGKSGGPDVSAPVRSFPAWKNALESLDAVYGIRIRENEIGDRLTVRELSELAAMRVYSKLEKGGGLRVFAGFDNYTRMADDAETLAAFRNNAVWLVMFTMFSVGLGIFMAKLISMTSWKTIAKAVIFIPMSISYVASAVIWSFMYDKDPKLGTVNAFLTWITGIFSGHGASAYEPIAFLGRPDTVNGALIAAALWIWCGFCVVIFTAALNGISSEVLEASKMDGANPFQTFFLIEVPLIAPTIAVVTTTMIINVLKIFDIVYTMTGGGPSGASEVIANRMYGTAFIRGDAEYASAMAVVLFLAIVPVMIVNIRNFIRLSTE
jgi:alpha-glucoside transport system permease protein